ncbi:GFA family protein [uncultured Aliiroseovarius sp.]|uniref:GFA family protein n=1 Tax=uncultured Aliiroseovarius sp. TaxID=1658783 RepID=UPI0026390937|nr:GFA family protein [uncultured Aliiroseovarius sp.]
MESKFELTGKCMCGAVKFTGTANKPTVAACHCDMCRRWSSGPFFEISCENVSFQGENNISKIRSSDWAERGFCNKCGSNLFYHILDSNEFQIAAGLLDDQSELQLTLQVFIDEKPPFYTLADKTETMTGAELFAAYAPKSD